MNIKKLEAVVEAILFSMGEAVEIERLAAAVDHDEDTVRKIIRSMMTRYDEEDRGIHLWIFMVLVAKEKSLKTLFEIIMHQVIFI